MLLVVVGIEVEEVVDSVAADVTGTSGIITFVVASEIACVVMDNSVDEADGAVEAEPLSEPCASVILSTGVVVFVEGEINVEPAAEAGTVSAYRNKRNSDTILYKCY